MKFKETHIYKIVPAWRILDTDPDPDPDSPPGPSTPLACTGRGAGGEKRIDKQLYYCTHNRNTVRIILYWAHSKSLRIVNSDGELKPESDEWERDGRQHMVSHSGYIWVYSDRELEPESDEWERGGRQHMISHSGYIWVYSDRELKPESDEWEITRVSNQHCCSSPAHSG